jgi:hypothetical protein
LSAYVVLSGAPLSVICASEPSVKTAEVSEAIEVPSDAVAVIVRR